LRRERFCREGARLRGHDSLFLFSLDKIVTPAKAGAFMDSVRRGGSAPAAEVPAVAGMTISF
jgi:hypothetical protein